MMGSLDITLVWSALVMLSFFAVPRRCWYVQLPAVLALGPGVVRRRVHRPLAVAGVSMLRLWFGKPPRQR